ncbi:MAG: class I SAM-dependent methyltransferase [Thermoanaerobaculia bacterium]
MSTRPVFETSPADSIETRDASRSRTGPFDRWLLGRIVRGFRPARIRFRLWDGTELSASDAAPAGTVIFRERRALLDFARDPELQFGEGYAAGRIEVNGDLVGVLEEGIRAGLARPKRARRPRVHSLRSSRVNARRHYDVGNDFYTLWLDREMVYTCAYFDSPETTLEEAQRAKMDYVCRKVGLTPGMAVVEAGCGWGALALFMARHYGVTVKAYNVSAEQMLWARRRAQEEGLADRVEFLEEDYRAIRGTFDAFVSVGMLEHVGRENYPVLGDVIARCLKPQGRGLVHFIGRDRTEPLNSWMERRIFPGAYPPTLAEVLEGVLETGRLSAIDVENLRLHYAKTARAWRTRFEAALAFVTARFGESFARAWHLYLAGSEAAFAAGSLQLFQIAFARSGMNGVPWTRAPLYAADGNR